MTTTANFLGIPIAGDITRGTKRANQRPLDEFAPLMQALLDDPTVTEFGWTQYTPYFNDGDPCTFRANSLWVRTVTDDEDADTEDLGVQYGTNHSLGDRPYRWENRQRIDLAYEGPDEARYDRCMALAAAIDGGEFDEVLLGAFGDHAEVTVSTSGIAVEFYEHD